MNTYTNVASLRRIIGNLFPTDEFIPTLNQALERLVNGGLWKGTIGYAAFPTVDSYFTLPYPFLSVIGAQWFRTPIPVFGQFHEFIMGGPGQPIAGASPSGTVTDMGDGYATMADPPTSGSTLRFTVANALDDAKVVRLYGTTNGVEIFDDAGAGMDVTLDYPTTDVATVFDTITGIQLPVATDGSSDMAGALTVSAVAPDSTVTQLSYYYPNETTPCYRRYLIGVTDADSADVPNAVTVLVRRRFMPVFKETDWVVPGNISALKFAMQAIDAESSKNMDTAAPLWKQVDAVLNQELHATRGATRPENLSFEGGFNLTNVH